MNRFITPTRVGVVLAGAVLAAAAVWAVAGRLPVSKPNVAAAASVAKPACAHGASVAECPAITQAECAAAMKKAESASCPACPACPATPSKSAAAVTAQRAEKKAPTRGAGMVAAIDPQSGELTAPTAEQAAALQALGVSSADPSMGIEILRRANGSVVAIDRAGLFQQFSMVTVGPDGKLHAVCAQGPVQAAEILRNPPVPQPAPAAEEK